MRKQLKEIQRSLKDGATAAKQAAAETTKHGRSLSRLQEEAKRVSGAISGVKKVLGAAGFIGVAIGAARRAGALVDKMVEVRNVFGNAVVNVDAAAFAVDNMTTKLELQRQANTLTNAELKLSDQTYAQFAGTVAKLADSTGRELVPMLRAATESIIRGNIEGIAGLGIKLDTLKILEREAAALGKTTAELTLVEKRQIALNALLIEGARATKDYEQVNLGLAGSFVQLKNASVDYWDAAFSGQQQVKAQRDQAIDLASEFRAQGLTLDEIKVKHEEWVATFGDGAAAMGQQVPRLDQVTEAWNRMEEGMRGVQDRLIETGREVTKFDFESLGLVGGGPAQSRAGAFKAKTKRGGGRAQDPATESELRLAEIAREQEASAGIGQTEGRRAQVDEELQIIQERNELELALEQERGQNILDMRLRQIEEARELGADPIVMMEQEQEALIEHNDLLQELNDDRVVRLQLVDDRRQIVHDANLKRMRVEANAEKRRAAEQRALFAAVTGAAQQHASNIEEASRLAGRGQAAAHAVAMGIRGAVEVAEAAAAFARYDFFAGAAHTVAAGLAFGAMGKAIAESGGVGGGSRAETLPQTLGGGTPGGPQSVAPTGGGGGGGTPISPGAPGTATQQSTRGGGGNITNVSQSFDGAIILDEVELGEVVIRAVRAATEVSGEIT